MSHAPPPRFCPILVGRNTEYATGAAALAGAVAGRGGALLLSGEAGMGKSRLMRALVDAAIAQGFRVIGGVCQEQDRDYPFAPFLDALRQQTHTTPGTNLADLLGPEHALLARLLPELDPPGTDAAPVLPPEQEKRRLFEAYVRVFARLARDTPLLITLEDMHWSDEASIELLQLLPRRLAAARALVIVTARTDEPANRLDPWMTATARDARTTHLALAPLTHEEVARMVVAMVETPVPAAVIDAISQRAEGNPFVVEELVHAVARDLIHERRAATERYIPASTAETISRRLDQCGASAVRVAECAAVIGRSFSFDLLRRVVDQDEGEETVVAAMRALVAAHLVIEAEAEGAHAFVFRHALTRDAIYRRLLGPERQRLHRRVAHALDEDRPSRSPPESELAHHYFAGAEWAPALAHSRGRARRRRRSMPRTRQSNISHARSSRPHGSAPRRRRSCFSARRRTSGSARWRTPSTPMNRSWRRRVPPEIVRRSGRR